MGVKEATAAKTRRGDRISISIPVQIASTDAGGDHFSEIVQTVNVSRSGCCLLMKRSLFPGQKIYIQRMGNHEEAVGRVVGQTGLRDEGNLFGIEIVRAGASFWGIHFPEQQELEQGAGRTLLKCTSCLNTEEVAMNEVQLSVFQITHHITRRCSVCFSDTLWEAVPDTPDPRSLPTEPGAPGSRPNRRKHARVSMKTSACVGSPGSREDVVEVINVSRGGICFRSSRIYNEDSWVQVAVPYTKGAANIFVAGRIVRCRVINGTLSEYGVEYVRE
jgi:hypothetical protein